MLVNVADFVDLHHRLFTNIGLADDGTSPVRWLANVRLDGSSSWISRPLALDTMVVGPDSEELCLVVRRTEMYNWWT